MGAARGVSARGRRHAEQPQPQEQEVSLALVVSAGEAVHFVLSLDEEFRDSRRP